MEFSFPLCCGIAVADSWISKASRTTAPKAGIGSGWEQCLPPSSFRFVSLQLEGLVEKRLAVLRAHGLAMGIDGSERLTEDTRLIMMWGCPCLVPRTEQCPQLATSLDSNPVQGFTHPFNTMQRWLNSFVNTSAHLSYDDALLPACTQG